MSFNWEEYLGLANMLAGIDEASCSEEAKQRAAISRAYYAAMHAAKNYIYKSSGNSPRHGKSIHAWVLKELETAAHIEAVELEVKLRRLKTKRMRADYVPSIRRPDQEMKSALREAKEIIDKLNAL